MHRIPRLYGMKKLVMALFGLLTIGITVINLRMRNPYPLNL